MRYSWIIFPVLFFQVLTINAQNKLEGAYDDDEGVYHCTDPNIIIHRFINGCAAFMIKGVNPNDWKTNRVGFIDTNGKVIVRPVYTNCSNFNGNCAHVQDTARNTALINKKGQVIIPFAQQNIQWCSNGLYIITNYRQSSGLCIVDAKGRDIVPFGKYSSYLLQWPSLFPERVRYSEGRDYGDDYRRFAWQQLTFYKSNFYNYMSVRTGIGNAGKWGVINREGKEIIQPAFDAIGPFINGAAPFCLNKKYGVIDTAGNRLIPAEYDNIAVPSRGFVIAIQNKKWGVVSVENKIAIPFNYDGIDTIGTGAFLVDTGMARNNTPTDYQNTAPISKYGVINHDGEIIIPLENESILSFGTGYVVYKKSDSAAVFDSGGVQKTPYSKGVYLSYPVCSIGKDKGYLVYNERKHDFIHYDLIDRLFYKEGDKWGRLDSTGQEVTKPLYEKFWFLSRYQGSGNIVAAKHDGIWDIIDREGKEAGGGPYDEITEESSSFYKVKKAGKYGLLDAYGKVIVPARYDLVEIAQYNPYFNDIIVSLGGKQSYYSFTGRQIAPLKYDSVKPFADSLGQVMINNKWGIINTRGVEIVPCKYDEATPGPLILVSDNKLYGLINHAGKIVMPAVCSSITGAWHGRRMIYTLIRNGKTGMADASGKLFLPFIYDGASPFEPYSIGPVDKLLVKNKGFTGVTDTTGKIIVPIIYDNVGVLNGTSRHRYLTLLGGKHGVAGEHGHVTIPPAYDQVIPVNGVSQERYIIIKDKKTGIADSNGKIIIPVDYMLMSGISDRSLVISKDLFFGVIDWKQNIIVPAVYESIEVCNYGYIVRLQQKLGVMDLNGNPVIPIVYDYISCYLTNVFFVTKDRKMGVINDSGKIILPAVYDELSNCGKENILMKKDNLMGMIDYTGKVIYPCKYTFINCADGKVVEIY